MTGRAPASADWKMIFVQIGAVQRIGGIAPRPSLLLTSPVAATPGWAAVAVSVEPAADARRWSSRANRMLASLVLPYAVCGL